jgi:hypothetical protein
MKNILTLTILLLLHGVVASAQVILSPLQQENRSPAYTSERLQLKADAVLNLPFFDDFAGSSNTPDLKRWKTGGGVYINDRYALEPITKNVASFDGLNAKGKPYAPGAVGAGPSDTLTSQPILLANLNPSDSLYLSFYWQSGGLGDVPDRSSADLVNLLLEFKDASGNWQQVWKQPGLGQVTSFAQVFVGLKEARYFHNNFQFRFRSIGERNGLADVWNVDYIVLDKNRRKGQNTTRDIAISEGISKLLKNYTAMPYNQFLQNPSAELAGQVKATVNNLGNMPGAISWRGYIKKLSDSAADTFLRNQALIPSGARQFPVIGNPTVGGLTLPKTRFVLVHGLVLNTKEQNLQERANDSTERKTHFSNYYAYDDGSAEAGFSFVSSSSTQVAQRFDLNQPDQVEAFKIYFPRMRTNLSGTTLTFKVWDDENGAPGKTLHQQSFQIQYSDSLNGFYEVQLTKLVPVEGKFYIGWQQPGNLFVNVGFDRNEKATGRRFLFTTLNNWKEETELKGAIMMRPIMAGEALGLEEELAASKIKVYPNPTSGKFFIDGEYERFRVYDITGREVYSQSFIERNEPITLSKLAPGLYTLRIQTRKAIITKKIILTQL